jgi:thiamine biosynthesis protein ThiI
MSNKVISLISGGLDSPIAAYLMLKKGYIPIFLSFITSSEQYEGSKKKIARIINSLKKYSNQILKLYLIDHISTLETLINKCNRKLTCVLCKRMMIRISKKIAEKEKTNILLMGDILAEQASQTLDNLNAYNDLMQNIVLLRPLIGFNKLEVIELNRTLNFYDITSEDIGGCQYYPKYPETNAKEEDLEFAESIININEIIDDSVREAEVLKF